MPEQKRKLAAIMFTDIVGYTAMMQRDELSGLANVKRYRRELNRLTKDNDGEILKHSGDGSLIIFSSAVNAIRCALDLQMSLKAKTSEEGEIPEVPLRIGLHVGDIIIEGDDIFGNGVNIASRVESLGQSGTILFTHSIYEKIHTLPEFQITSLGSFHFKNVEEPMKVYALSNEYLIVPEKRSIIGKLQESKPGHEKPAIPGKWIIGVSIVILLIIIGSLTWNTVFRTLFMDKRQRQLESINSIAILPFANYTGDESQTFWVSGMHDDLIYEIGQLEDLRVISKTSTLPYTNSQKSIQEIASELKVDALIETSVQEVGDSIKLQLKLIHAFPEEEQLWLQSFEIVKSDILNLYSEITKNIASQINLTLTPQEEALLATSKPVNPDVYEAYLKGKFNMGYLTREGQQAAIDYFTKAIEIDPEFAPAHAALGGVWAFLKQMDFVSTEEANPEIAKHLAKAYALDTTLADVYYWQAIKKVWTDFDWENGEIAFRQSIKLQPNFSESRALFSHLLMILNRWDESREQMNKALEIDPNNPFVQVLNGMVLMCEENYDVCIEQYESLEKMMPNNPLIILGLLVGYSKTGQYDKAVQQGKKWIGPVDNEAVVQILEEEYEKSGFTDAFNAAGDALAERMDTVFISAQKLFVIYALAGNTEKTLYWVERGYIRRDPDIPYAAVVSYLNPYHNEPRFTDILKGMNLSLDKKE